MAARSNTLKQKSTGFKFHWWMAVILIGIIAVIGILILRFSHAGAKPTFSASNFSCPASIYGIPTQTITQGMETKISSGGNGGCVLYWQDLLTGYQRGTSFKSNVNIFTNDDYGVFGPSTTLVTKSFQKSQGLTPDGIVGPLTWAAIIKACYVDLQCDTSFKDFYHPYRGGIY